MSDDGYPGRGVLVGRCAGGDGVAVAVWLTGRSEASRNRRLDIDGPSIETRFLPSVAETADPTYRVYTAARWSETWLVAGNGDHVAAIAEALEAGTAFGAALEADTFEHDPPIWTPRIVGAIPLAPDFTRSYRLGEAYRSAAGAPAWLSFTFADLAAGPPAPGPPAAAPGPPAGDAERRCRARTPPWARVRDHGRGPP